MRYGWIIGGLELGEGHHHEESIDNNAYEFMDVDVVFWLGRVLCLPGWEGAEDVIVKSPLEGEGLTISTHSYVACIRAGSEVGVSWNKEAQWPVPYGRWGCQEK